jgi:hypothetical protein
MSHGQKDLPSSQVSSPITDIIDCRRKMSDSSVVRRRLAPPRECCILALQKIVATILLQHSWLCHSYAPTWRMSLCAGLAHAKNREGCTGRSNQAVTAAYISLEPFGCTQESS